jgi:hypothetical protein
MANEIRTQALMPSPTIFSYTVRAEGNVKSTVDIYMAYDAATETVASLLGAAAAFGGLIDAITGGVIEKFNILIPALPDPSWKDTVVADINSEKSLLLNFAVTDSIYPEPIVIPAVLGTLIDSDGKPILTAAGAIDNFAQLVHTGSGAIYPNNKFLVDLLGLRDASVSFRKRKGSKAKSKRVAS